MMTCGNLVRIVFLLLVGGSLCAFALAQAADRHTLVLKDGRRIDVDYYEESGDWFYYYRYDARIGVARAKIAEIITHSQSHPAVPLEEEILGRVFATHDRRFTLGDFLREDYYAAEIEPRLSPEEQQAYVRKLLYLKKVEIFEIDDLRMAAEMNGDVVEMAAMEQKLIAALVAWGEGQAALNLLAQRHRPKDPREDKPAHAVRTNETETTAGRETAVAVTPPADVSDQDTPVAAAGLEQLKHRQEMLRLFMKKNYQSHANTGGFFEWQEAEQNLRIVNLQIRFFNRLPSGSTTFPMPVGQYH